MSRTSTPIIVGVGQFANPLDAPEYTPMSPVEIAAAAARAAIKDAGGATALAPHVDAIVTTRTFEDTGPPRDASFGKSNNFPRSIAKCAGIQPDLAIWAHAGGNTPQTLLSEMFDRIGSGELSMVLLAGGEAVSTVRALVRGGGQVDWSETLDEPVEDRGSGLEGLMDEALTAHGVFTAPSSYGLIENARRANRQRSRTEYAREMAELFAPFSEVAARNPFSSTRRAYSADELREKSDGNRLISDPYTRLLVARDQVNQGAAVLLTSVERARKLGIPESKWVYLNGRADLREQALLERADLGASPAAELAVNAALSAAGIGVSDLSFIDLYSCFPISVFAVSDALGLDVGDPRRLTTTGGLPYFGGPGSNYSMHGIASVVERVRDEAGSYGLVGANGGVLSKYSVGIYSTHPTDWNPGETSTQQAQIDSLPSPPTALQAEGAAEVETYTLEYDRNGTPSKGIVIGRLSQGGERFVAATEEGNLSTLRAMHDTDPLGRSIRVRAAGVGNRFAFDDLI